MVEKRLENRLFLVDEVLHSFSIALREAVFILANDPSQALIQL
jgi:hypothetical protein